LDRFVQVEEVQRSNEIGRKFVRLRGEDLGSEDVVRKRDEGEVELGRERRRVGGREEEDDVKEEWAASSNGESVSVGIEREIHQPWMDREEEAGTSRKRTSACQFRFGGG
jgi:hypothetical protein